jgi:hypothetical protein
MKTRSVEDKTCQTIYNKGNINLWLFWYEKENLYRFADA